MLIGAMNHPAEDVVNELKWMADFGLGFVDLTLEPPAAAAWQIDRGKIRAALDQYKLKAVGHTAFYLPLASPFETVRKAAVAELRCCVDAFADIGIRWMNIHPDRNTPLHSRSYFISRNLISLQEIMQYGEGKGVGIMIENLPGDFNNPEQLGELLDPLPELGLHLDIGHANLLVPHNTTEAILQAYGSRLRHVHLHDNKGGIADLHLPLGSGTVDVPRAIRALKKCGYDGTITLEVFTPDRHFLRYSQQVLQTIWDKE
jgi:sugar phosphate isomerase/epimerase